MLGVSDCSLGVSKNVRLSKSSWPLNKAARTSLRQQMRQAIPLIRCVLLLLGTGIASVNVAAAECPLDAPKLREALRSNVKASGGPGNGGFETTNGLRL